MSSPGMSPRSNDPAASPGGKNGPPQPLRVLLEDGTARAAAPSIAMPRTRTELSELLAGDDLLCVRRRVSVTATQQNAAPQPQAESPGAPSAQRVVESRDRSPRVQTLDEGLGRVIDVWPGLPRNVRAAILAIIRETSSDDVRESAGSGWRGYSGLA
ncbi:MAG: hypothetical protein WCJ35_20150 [Planctomycetota bacterium]